MAAPKIVAAVLEKHLITDEKQRDMHYQFGKVVSLAASALEMNLTQLREALQIVSECLEAADQYVKEVGKEQVDKEIEAARQIKRAEELMLRQPMKGLPS